MPSEGPHLLYAAFHRHRLSALRVPGGGEHVASPLLARLPASEREAARHVSARRFVPLAWLCLATFVVTGLTQMSANPGYAGLLVVRDSWSAAVLVKHLVVGLMAAVLGDPT